MSGDHTNCHLCHCKTRRIFLSHLVTQHHQRIISKYIFPSSQKNCNKKLACWAVKCDSRKILHYNFEFPLQNCGIKYLLDFCLLPLRIISLNKKFCKWSHVWNTLSIDTCLKLIILTVRKWQQEETNNPTYHKLLTKQTHKVLQFIVSITVQTGADQSSGKYILRSIKIWNYDSGRAIITGYQPVRWL